MRMQQQPVFLEGKSVAKTLYLIGFFRGAGSVPAFPSAPEIQSILRQQQWQLDCALLTGAQIARLCSRLPHGQSSLVSD